LLRALVEQPGAVVSKDALIEAAWPDKTVEESNLTVQIATLRRVLGEAPGGNGWIETMPRRGYRFVGPIATSTENGVVVKAEQVHVTSTPHAEAERRQITAMSCELVGNAGQADGIDLEDWREAVGAFRHCVSETAKCHDGFIHRHFGNDVLVLFGYPAAHEQDAEQAVRAGLQLCAAVRALRPDADLPMRCRVGIATGMVIVGDGFGGSQGGRHEIVGETPEMAVRLRISAPPDMVAIEPVTRRLVGDLFDYCDLDALETGDTEPIRAWQVVGESRFTSRFDALRGSARSPLIGRDDEIDLLLRRWAHAKAGDGQIVLVSGEAGIGKSRLAAQLAAEVASEPYTRLHYQCSPYYRDSVLHPFVVALGRAARVAPEDPAEKQLDKLEAMLASSSVTQTAPLFASLLSIPTGGRYPPLALSAAQQRRLTLGALLDQLEALARREPVLMLFEDAHWADATSLEVLDLTVERIRALPVLALITFRPEYEAPWTGLSHVTSIAPDRLAPAEVEILAERVAGRPLPPEVTAQIVAKTDGVPLFVEELTRAVIEAGAGPGGEALAGATLVPSSGVPPALHASLIARLDRLGPAVREAAQIGAVLGREFPYDLIARVAQPQHTEADLQAALGALTGAGLLFCRGVAPRSSYLFKHALIQDAAYETLLRARRRELHRTAAQTIAAEFAALAEAQPELIARHWSGAGDAEHAFAAWRKAGDVARSRNAFSEARAAYRHALDRLALTPPSPERDTSELELLLASSQMIAATRGSTSSDRVKINARAADLAAKTGNLGRLAEHIYGSWRAAGVAGDHPSAMVLADRLLDVARRDGGAFTGGLASYAQLWSRFYIGDLPGAEDHFVSGEAFLSDRDLRRYFVATWMLSTAGFNAWIMGRADEARARMRRAVATIEDDAFARIILQWSCSFLHVMLREPEQTAMLAARAIATAGEHGFRQFGLGPRMADGWVQAQLGHPDKGASLIREALTAYRANGSLVSVPTRLTWLAEAQALGDAPADGLRTIEEALTVNPAERYWRPETLRLRGEVRSRQGEEELAEADFRDAIALAREMSAKAWELRAATSLARLWREQGRRAEARDLVASVYSRFTEGFDTPDLKEAKTLLDELV
jgi:DNA-binding winged helix-turn-helix (wHTH) protein/tetratricopeptide (TPR) repeat protein